MDDMNAFERQLAAKVVRMAGPDPHFNALEIARITATQSPKWRIRPLFSATRFVVAGAIVALFGGLLLVAQPSMRVGVIVPGVETERLPPVTGPAGNGLIAFERDGDIHVGDPATGESTALIAGPESDTHPVFSPDGTRIAFLRTNRPADETDDGDFDIAVVSSDGSDERLARLPSGPFGRTGGDFVWSPDSSSLVLTQWTGGAGPEMALWLVDAAGVTEARPLSGGLPGPYGFHGEQVAWFMRPPAADRMMVDWWSEDPILAVRDLDGSVVLDLGQVSGLVEMGYRTTSHPAWSPDASQILFTAVIGSEFAPVAHLYVMDEDGSDLRRLVEDDDGSSSGSRTEGGDFLGWSPDGSTVAGERVVRIEPGSTDSCPGVGYNDYCGGASWIRLIDVATGEKRDLRASYAPEPTEIDPPPPGGSTWSPDGRYILRLREEGGRPELIDIETDTATRLPWEVDSVPSWQRVAAD